ncbi:helix-turn-helix transcriptional regulator [Legionella sainthelensi]|uniref:helix-turn-helix transcriptional regulator n=1 Tax=Legionella sainthelensi TaxID=28087 RepID=UPI000C7D27E3|nr:helix-turn-helix domain-containing protein [Legionella sainthelensi]
MIVKQKNISELPPQNSFELTESTTILKHGLLSNPIDRFIGFPETSYRMCLGKTALYELIKRGELKPIKLGRKTVFLESEIIGWVNNKVAARNEVLK